MDIRDFELLVALEEHRHFARAAAACAISQPAFSARIQKLEQELGAPIVQRGGRFEGFTAEGEAVLRWAHRILNSTRGMRQELGRMRQALEGKFTLGVIPSALPFVGRLSADMVAAHPNLQIAIFSLTSIEIQRRIDGFTLDAALTYLDNEPLQRIRSMPLYRERYFLIAPKDLIAPNPAGIAWKEAAKLPLALLGPDMQYRRIIDSLFAASGTPVEPAVMSSSFTVLLGHVRSGRTATIMPQVMVEAAAMDGLHASPLIEPDESHVVGLIVPDRDPMLPGMEVLLDIAKRHAEAAFRER